MLGLAACVLVLLGFPDHAAAQQIVLTPNPRDIGSTNVNTTLDTSFTIENAAGEALDLSVTAIAERNLAGENCAAFTITTPASAASPIVIAPGATAPIDVTFAPTTVGSATCTIRLTSNDRIGSPQDELTLTATATGAKIVLPASPVALGSTSLNTTVNGSFTIGNDTTASQNLSVTDITETPQAGDDCTRFAVTTTTLTVAPGASQAVAVTFTPTVVGTASCTISISSNDANAPHTLQLQGAGTAPEIVLPASPHDLGSAIINTTLNGNFTIGNNAAATEALDVSSITETAQAGDDCNRFAITTTAPLSIAPGGTQSIAVTFTPNAVATFTCTITISSDDPTQPHTLRLRGTGTEPKIVLPASPYNIGTTIIRTTLNSSFPITNDATASASLQVTSITQSPQGGDNCGLFTVNTAGLPLTLAPGASQDVPVAFTSTTAGTFTCRFQISSNDPDTPSTTLRLQATATEPKIVLPTSPYDLGSTDINTTLNGNFAITNDGTASASLQVTSITETPQGTDNCAVFTENTASLPLTLAAGASQNIPVTFTPTTAATFTCTIQIASNDPDAPHTLQLRGTGTARPKIVLPTSPYDVGSTSLGVARNSSFAIGNDATATASLSITSITAAAQAGDDCSVFAVDITGLPATVAAGASRTFNVTFTPTAAGAETCRLQIVSNDPGSPHFLVLQGTGLAPQIILPTSPYDLGSTSVGTTLQGSFTIQNAGVAQGDLVVSAIAFNQQAGEDCSVFTLTPPTLPFTLAPSASQIIDTDFSPTTSGTRTCTVRITSNNTGSPHSVQLRATGLAPQIILPTSPYDLADTLVGTTQNGSFTIQNAAAAQGNLIITSLTENPQTGDNCNVFALNPPLALPATVTPGGTQAVSVTFTPVSTIQYTCTIRIQSNDAGSPHSLVLRGRGVQPDIDVNPLTINFGDQRLNIQSAAQTITIRNVGNSALSVMDIVLAGANPGDFDFTITTAPPFSLNPNGSTTIDVTFTPTALGARSAILRILSDDPDEGTVNVTLNGNGVLQDINVLNTTLSFGQVLINTSSTPQSVTIQNTGTADLSITNIALVAGDVADFQITVPAFPATVAPSGSIAVPVTFRPTSAGNKAATLRITSNDPDEATVNVALDGTGMEAPNISVSATTISFGGQRVTTTSTPRPFSIANEAGTFRFPLDVSSIAVVSGHTTDFAVSITTATVNPGQNVTVNVTFTPTAIGPRAAVIRVTSNDPDTPTIDINVDGVGEQPIIAVDPLAIDFGSIPVNNSSDAVTVTATNNGNTNLVISNVALNNTTDFSFNGVTSAIVAPGSTISWNVFCSPTQTNARAGRLTITSDDLNTPSVQVTLACTGIPAYLALNPPAIFPDTYIGDTATPLTVQVINQANQSITVTSIQSSLSVFTVTAATPFTLANRNDAQNITLGFMPVANQAYAGTLTFVTDRGTFLFPISGRGVEAIMAIETLPPGGQPYDFGNVKITTPSGPATFTIRNTGTYPFSVSSITVNNTSDFAITPPSGTSPWTVAPGSSTTFAVEAIPMITGLRQGIVTIQTNIRGSMTATFPVRVTGTTPEIDLSDTSLVFGAVDVQNTTPTRRTLTIANTGTHVLSIENVALTGDTAYQMVSGQPTTAVIIPSESFDITVEYRPTIESASDDALLTITSDAPGAGTVQVPITGRGIDRHLMLSALEVNFPETYRNPEAPPQEVLTIQNTGDAVLRIAAIMNGGPDASAFSIQNASIMEVGPQASEDLIIEFTPSAVRGDYSATLTIMNDDNQNAMAQVILRGAGVLPNVAFGPGDVITVQTGVGVPVRLSEVAGLNPIRLVNMDPQDSFTVREVLVTDMNGAPVENGPFRIVGFAPDTELAAMQGLDIDVEFNPEQVGTFEAVVEVYLDADPIRVAYVTIQGQAHDIDLRGGGCHVGASRHHSRGTFVLVMVVLALMHLGRRMRKAWGTLALLVLVMSGMGSARADDARNLDLSTFRPAPGVESRMLSVESPGVAKSGAWALGVAVEHAINPLTVRIPMEGEEMLETPIATRTVTDLLLSYAFAKRFEAGLIVPLLQQSGDAPTLSGIQPPEGTAIGDIALHSKVMLAKLSRVGLAGSAMLTLPTANDGQFAGLNGPSVRVLGIAGIGMERVHLALNGGVWLRGKTRLADAEQGNAFTYGAATELRVAKKLSLVGELYGALGMGAGEPAAVSPLETALGLRFRPSRQVFVGAGVGRGLMPGIGAPDFRAFLMMSYSPQASEIPRLGTPPGPRDLTDDDSDGIINTEDECRTDAEDIDLFQDEDGCPDQDNDSDGVADIRDECPLDVEDKDKFKDQDGCPDPDNDGDKVPDAKDKCPNGAEDMDGYGDLDGCDDPDNDQDGIPDVIDQCVLERETINGNKDEDGCPDKGDALVMVMADRIEVFEPVRFRADTARLVKTSDRVLAQVAATLRSQHDILRIRIAAHVHPLDSKDEQRSVQRARAVKEWLVKWGIEPERIEIKGYGSDQLLVPENQRGAKEINDRVEFIIVEKRIGR